MVSPTCDLVGCPQRLGRLVKGIQSHILVAIGGSKITVNSGDYRRVPFTKNIARYSGETHNTTTRCPGSSTSKVLFDRTRWENPNDQWYTPSLPCHNEASFSYYRSDCNDGDSSFNIWDSR